MTVCIRTAAMALALTVVGAVTASDAQAPQRIIFDTDFVIPPQDDAMALLLALKSPELQIVDLFVDVDDHPGPSCGVTVGGQKIWEGAEGAGSVSVQYDVDFDRFIRLFVERLTRK